jgi:hypothetical protein
VSELLGQRQFASTKPALLGVCIHQTHTHTHTHTKPHTYTYTHTHSPTHTHTLGRASLVSVSGIWTGDWTGAWTESVWYPLTAPSLLREACTWTLFAAGLVLVLVCHVGVRASVCVC